MTGARTSDSSGQVESFPNGIGNERTAGTEGSSQGERRQQEDRSQVIRSEDEQQDSRGQDRPDPTRFGDWEKNGRCIDF